MKIVFIGASVTAQGINHKTQEIVGYTEILSEKLRDNLNFDVVRNFSYPGNRLSDAGLVKLQEVIEAKPDICLVEPLIEDSTRGVEATINEMYYFYTTLLMNNIYPVTVFLPNPKSGHCRDWINYDNLKNINTELNIPIIELEFQAPIDSTYVNGVHTTNKGAILYGEEIYNQFYSIVKNGIPKCEHPKKTRDNVFVTRIAGSSNNEILLGKVFLQGQGNVKVVQKSKIGPRTPVLKYTVNYKSVSTENEVCLWDPYCHYVRGAYSILLPKITLLNSPLELMFSISNTLPDYKKCRRDEIIWPALSELNLSPLQDAYIISDNKIKVSLIPL
jgi:hypothetical protein